MSSSSFNKHPPGPLNTGPFLPHEISSEIYRNVVVCQGIPLMINCQGKFHILAPPRNKGMKLICGFCWNPNSIPEGLTPTSYYQHLSKHKNTHHPLEMEHFPLDENQYPVKPNDPRSSEFMNKFSNMSATALASVEVEIQKQPATKSSTRPESESDGNDSSSDNTPPKITATKKSPMKGKPKPKKQQTNPISNIGDSKPRRGTRKRKIKSPYDSS